LEYARREDSSWLFLSCLPDQREYLRPLFSAWLTLGIKGVMQRGEQGKRRTWIIIDELASLNRLPTLMTGLAEIRKYGGCFVLGFQDLSQLDELYGMANTKTFSNLIGTKVLFRHGDTDLAQRVARYLGEQEKMEAQESISYGAHQMRDGVNLATQKQKHAVVSASDIMILENLECYLRFPGNLPVAKVKYDYMDLPLHKDAFIPKTQVFSTETNETEEGGEALEGMDEGLVDQMKVSANGN
jgi:type IV secretory pathway TraG/TraD family ATPase VirD4